MTSLAQPAAAADNAVPAWPVSDMVLRQSRIRPDAIAVAAGGSELTYAGLEAHAGGIGTALAAAGSGPGRPVVIRMPTGPDQAAAVLATLRSGAYVVCLGPADPGERGRASLAGLGPAVMLVSGPAPDPLRTWFADCGGTVIDVAAVAPAAVEPKPAPRLADRAYVAYTSGSTGVPKGIAMTHAALAQFTGWLAAQFDIGRDSRVAQWAAPGYDASLGELFAGLISGATVHPVPERFRGHPGKVLEWLAAERITFFQTVPSFARALLKQISVRGADAVPADLTHLLLAGEPLPADLANRLRAVLPGVRLVNLYGPTESILATFHEITEDVPERTPVGRAIPGRRVLVLDPDDRPSPMGTPGEIVIGSPYVTTGYLGSDARTDVFRAPAGAEPGLRWYRTGDRGVFRPDGVLEFLGRGDQQIKFHGVRLEISDIEATLMAHEALTQCAVLAQTDPDGLVIHLVAYVVPDRAWGPGPLVENLRRHLRRRFGAAVPPVSFRTLDRLPRNAGGKVDRLRLPLIEKVTQ